MARFTTSLCQRKPSFIVEIALPGCIKDAQWRISAEKPFLPPDLIEYAFVGGSLSDTQFMGGGVLKWIMQCDLLTSALVQITGICAII